MTAVVLGVDAAWGGLGWCLATGDGPLVAGHCVPGSGDYRLARLLAQLEHVEQVCGAELAAAAERRVVVERLPWSYSRVGSQVRTVYGLAGVAHVVAAHFSRPNWLNPWFIAPATEGAKRGSSWVEGTGSRGTPGWRDWWGIRGGRGGGRLHMKLAAVSLVRGRGWGALLEGLDPVDREGDGPQGDVAEAVLIAVGAARHAAEAPPDRRRSAPPVEVAWRRVGA